MLKQKILYLGIVIVIAAGVGSGILFWEKRFFTSSDITVNMQLHDVSSGVAAVSQTKPIDTLTADLTKKWGVDCRNKKTVAAIASCILDWQEKNIHWCYTNPNATVFAQKFASGYPDCVVDMQFNQMKMGSFPVSKVMQYKLRNGKMFGACYTYATTYCAVARWNGLKCRVMEAKTSAPEFYNAALKGNYGVGYCGAAQKYYLDKLGLNCETWKKINWLMDADHFWAEVFIGGKWQIMEKPLWAFRNDTTKSIIKTGRRYADTGW